MTNKQTKSQTPITEEEWNELQGVFEEANEDFELMNRIQSRMELLENVARPTLTSPVRVWVKLASTLHEIPAPGSLVCVELPLNCMLELPCEGEDISEQIQRIAAGTVEE